MKQDRKELQTMNKTGKRCAALLAALGFMLAGLTGCAATTEDTIQPDKVVCGRSTAQLEAAFDESGASYFEVGDVLMVLIDSYNGYEVTENSSAVYYTGEEDSLYRMVMSLELEDEKTAEKLYEKTERLYDKNYKPLTDSDSDDATEDSSETDGDSESLTWQAGVWSNGSMTLQMVQFDNFVVIENAETDAMKDRTFTFVEEQVALYHLCDTWKSIQRIDNNTGEAVAIDEDSSTQVDFFQNGMVIFSGNDDQTIAYCQPDSKLSGGTQYTLNCGYSQTYESDLIFTVIYADSTPNAIAMSVGQATLYLTRQE